MTHTIVMTPTAKGMLGKVTDIEMPLRMQGAFVELQNKPQAQGIGLIDPLSGYRLLEVETETGIKGQILYTTDGSRVVITAVWMETAEQVPDLAELARNLFRLKLL